MKFIKVKKQEDSTLFWQLYSVKLKFDLNATQKSTAPNIRIY